MGTIAATPSCSQPSRSTRLGLAWLFMCTALALHVTDEALTGFLAVYNPTVLAMRAKLGFWPMPTFEFHEWLFGLIAGISLLFALSPLAFRNTRQVRPLFYFCAGGNRLVQCTRTHSGYDLRPHSRKRPLCAPRSRFLLIARIADRFGFFADSAAAYSAILISD